MAKNREPGKGARTTALHKRVSEAADDLNAVCDAVVIVAVRFSGSNDNDEQIVRSTRGAHIAANKAIDMLCEYDESTITIFTDDEDRVDEGDV